VPASPPPPDAPGDAYDEALEALAAFGPEFGGSGLSNHGPMAAEALVALGRPEAVAPWVAAYRRRLEPGPGPGRPLDSAEWEAALGHMERYADWVVHFEAALAEHGPAATVARWVPRLAPGSIAAATHGLLRTAHAWRALGRQDRPGRRHELAQGLAYWAARYQELPGPPLLLGPFGAEEAVAALPALPEEAPAEPSISRQVAHLEMIAAPFEQAVAALGDPADPSAALAQLALAGTGALEANAGRGVDIALVHAVTAPMGLELLLGALDAADRPTVFAYGWQAVAALHATYATERAVPAPGSAAPSPDEVVEAALASGDEHAIKLAEAALRTAAATGSSLPLTAAGAAVGRLRA